MEEIRTDLFDSPKMEKIGEIKIPDPRDNGQESTIEIYKKSSSWGSGEDYYAVNIHLPLIPHITKETSKKIYDAVWQKIEEWQRRKQLSEPEPFSDEWLKKDLQSQDTGQRED